MIDTERCATVSEAVTDETVEGKPTLAVMAVRLKVVGGKVSEIETLVTREKEQASFYNPKALLETPVTDLELGITAATLGRNGGAQRFYFLREIVPLWKIPASFIMAK